MSGEIGMRKKTLISMKLKELELHQIKLSRIISYNSYYNCKSDSKFQKVLKVLLLNYDHCNIFILCQFELKAHV